VQKYKSEGRNIVLKVKRLLFNVQQMVLKVDLMVLKVQLDVYKLCGAPHNRLYMMTANQ